MTDKMKGSKCSCGKVSVPPVQYCGLCDTKPDLIDIDPSGTVLSYTRLHVTASGFDAPLGIALVELDDGTKFMCNAGVERDLDIGEKIKLTLKYDRLYIDI